MTAAPETDEQLLAALLDPTLTTEEAERETGRRRPGPEAREEDRPAPRERVGASR